jgi:hypothetical protein
MTGLMFATEQDRVKAMEGLEESPDNLGKLDEIRNAKIGVAEATETKVEATGSTPPEPKPDVTKDQPAQKTDDLKGYKTQGELLKAFDEQKSLIERQTQFIREKISQQAPAVDQSVIQRAEKAERELEQLKRGSQKPAEKTTVDIAAVQTEIQRIQTLMDELDKLAENDADVAYTADYQKKSRELQRLQTKNVVALTQLYGKAQQEIVEARRVSSEFASSITKTKETERQQSIIESEYKAMDTLDDSEYKLTKPSKEIEGEYIKWSAEIALAYYGRPAQSRSETFAALQQLQLKNSELLQKCQMMGFKAEPSQDVARYIEICVLMDYRDGFRKDPITGKMKRVTRFDPVSNSEVPIVMADLKSALKQKRLEEGYYDKRADGSFQQGAESVAKAAGRRDQGAVTLDGGKDQGQTPGGLEWAQRIVNESDPEEIMIAYRRGDKTKFDEMNKARGLLGMDPITFSE